MGRMTGLAVDIGETVTQVVPYFEGSPVICSEAVAYSDCGPLPEETACFYGGGDVTSYLAELLNHQDNNRLPIGYIGRPIYPLTLLREEMAYVKQFPSEASY